MENKIQKLNEYTYLIDGIEYDKRNVDEYNYLNSIGVFNKDIKIEVKCDDKEVKQVKEISKTNDKIENNSEEELFLCTHNDLITQTTNKQYNSYSYALQLGYVDNERVNGELNKFLYRKDIEDRRKELEESGVKVPSKRVLEKDLKLLSELGFVSIINTRDNGVCYIIRQSVNSKYFTIISVYRWKKLVTWSNPAMLRLYAILSTKCNCINHTHLTRKYLCMRMGIEPTESNQNYITNLMEGLKRLCVVHVKTKKEVTKLDNGKMKCVSHNYFRLTTEDEFKKGEINE